VRVIAERIDTILLVTGVLTRLAVVGFLFPDALLRNFFSEECRSVNVLLMVRHWSLLVFLVGGQLVYAAYQPAVRSAALVVATVEKLAIGALVAVSPGRKTRLAFIAGRRRIYGVVLFVVFLGPINKAHAFSSAQFQIKMSAAQHQIHIGAPHRPQHLHMFVI
jgi:hypothetical protein